MHAAHGDQGAVAKPNSSAPSMQAMATSRPLISLPSVSTMTRERRPFMIRGLVGLGHPQLPRHTGRMDGTAGGGAGAPVIAGDQYYLGPGLGHAGGDGAHPGSAHQLYRDAGLPVGILQVVDQLGQILDGVDVVVGRRGYQGDARCGMAGPGHLRRDLLPRQVAALAGLGP